MCGIAGRVNLGSRRPVDALVLEGMCDLLAHRGPDGGGVKVEGHAALGHRRLAIIDLSPAAHQPMVTDDGRFWITFNGELYNFEELRADFAARGYRFHSRSDTEVLLAAYAILGTACLQRLRGMFAFAIWDSKEESLFIARDRLGKKPLYYREDADGLSFASEPKAFLADPHFNPEPDLEALGQYLALQYVPSPLSAFRGVRKLPPAHYLLYKDNRLTIERYWTLKYSEKLQLSEDDAAQEFLRLLREAVRLRLISDVPLGAFLSGGIDSGTIVALMAEAGAGAVKTFSIGFDEDGFDELRFARLVATRYATDHHEFVVRPQALEVLPALVWHYNEPFADPSAIPTYHLSRLTRQHVTVALNGDAGDENFAGYNRYVGKSRDSLWRRVPTPLRRLAARGAALMPAPERSSSLLARAAEWLAHRAGSAEEQYVESMMRFRPRLLRSLCTADLAQAVGRSPGKRLVDVYRSGDGDGHLDRMLALDVATYLPDALLVKVDVASMAFGLEGRSPLLDHVVMEFVARLPSTLKLHHGVKKYLLRKVARPLLPEAITDRPKKGFSVPLDAWLRSDLRDMAHDVLLGSRAQTRGLFQMRTVERLLNEHVSGSANWGDQLWTLLMLELWYARFIDGRTRRVA